MTREELTEKMKDLPNSSCRVNLIQQVWEIMNAEIEKLDKENGKLEGKLADLQSEYIELENFHNNIVNGLKEQIEKMRNFQNCDYQLHIIDCPIFKSGGHISCKKCPHWILQEADK